MAAYDMQALKAYVTGGAPRQVAQGVVLLDVQHNLIEQRFVEIPFDVHQTIADVKDRVYTLCGTSPDHMHLFLNRTVYLDQETRTLASYGCHEGQPGHFLFVEDRDPFSVARGGGLHDTSLVKKYVMSDEDYRKRENTYYAHKQKMKAQDPNWQSMFEIKAKQRQQQQQQQQNGQATNDLPEMPQATLERVRVGMRCEVTPGGRRGVVSYIGPIPELTPHPLALPSDAGDAAAATTNAVAVTTTTSVSSPANSPCSSNSGSVTCCDASSEAPAAPAPVFFIWIGVTLDEPVASHDGVIHGKRYFTAPAKHGTFVKPWLVKVGDYPERDPFDELDDEDEEDGGDKKTDEAVDDLYEEM